jgi:AraC family transcriptional regulator
VGKRGSRQRRTVNLQVSGAPNQYIARGSVSFRHFYLTDGLIAEVAKGLNAPTFTTASLREDLVMFSDTELWDRLEVYASRSLDMLEPPSRLEMEARALLVCEHLVLRHHLTARKPASGGGLAPWQIRLVCGRMTEDLAAEPSLSELATLVGLSAEHFCRAFSQSTGLPPHRWLTRLRLERARVLLEQPGPVSVAEIASAAGYSDPSYFARAFKRATGATPLAYRRERRS